MTCKKWQEMKSAFLRQIIGVWMLIRPNQSPACSVEYVFFPPSSVVSPLLQGQHKIPAKKSQEWKCCSSETFLTDKIHWFGHKGIINFNIISEICSHFKTPGSFGSLYRPLCKYPLDPSKASSLTRSAFWALTATSYICKRWAKQVQLTWNRKPYRKTRLHHL